MSSEWLMHKAAELKTFNSRFMNDEALVDLFQPAELEGSTNSGSSDASELIGNDFGHQRRSLPGQAEHACKKQRLVGSDALTGPFGPFSGMAEGEVTSFQRARGFSMSLELDGFMSMGSMPVPEWASADLNDMLLPSVSLDVYNQAVHPGSAQDPSYMFQACADAHSGPQAAQALSPRSTNMACGPFAPTQGHASPSDLTNTRRKSLTKQIQKLMQLLPTASPSGPSATSLPQGKLKNGLGGLQSALRNAGLISDKKVTNPLQQFDLGADTNPYGSAFSAMAQQGDPFDVDMLMDLELSLFDVPTRGNSLEEVLSSLIDQAAAMQQKIHGHGTTKAPIADSASANPTRRNMLQALFAKHQGQHPSPPVESQVPISYQQLLPTSNMRYEQQQQQHSQPSNSSMALLHSMPPLRTPCYQNNNTRLSQANRPMPEAAQQQAGNGLARMQQMAVAEPASNVQQSFKSTVTTGNFFPSQERQQRLMHAQVLTKQDSPVDSMFARGSMSMSKHKLPMPNGAATSHQLPDGRKLMHNNSMDASTISFHHNSSLSPMNSSTQTGLGLQMHHHLHNQQQLQYHTMQQQQQLQPRQY